MTQWTEVDADTYKAVVPVDADHEYELSVLVDAGGAISATIIYLLLNETGPHVENQGNCVGFSSLDEAKAWAEEQVPS